MKKTFRQHHHTLRCDSGQRPDLRSNASTLPTHLIRSRGNSNGSVNLWVEPDRGLSSSRRHFPGGCF
jgi:hypothetical protein